MTGHRGEQRVALFCEQLAGADLLKVAKNTSCKRLEIDAEGNYWLHSESDDPRFAEPWLIGRPDDGHFTDMEVCIEGRVIRAVQLLDND